MPRPWTAGPRSRSCSREAPPQAGLALCPAALLCRLQAGRPTAQFGTADGQPLQGLSFAASAAHTLASRLCGLTSDSRLFDLTGANPCGDDSGELRATTQIRFQPLFSELCAVSSVATCGLRSHCHTACALSSSPASPPKEWVYWTWIRWYCGIHCCLCVHLCKPPHSMQQEQMLPSGPVRSAPCPCCPQTQGGPTPRARPPVTDPPGLSTESGTSERLLIRAPVLA